MKAPTSFVLLGMKTEADWQCAYNAVSHVEKGRTVELAYEDPEGNEITLTVQCKGRQIIVQKV